VVLYIGSTPNETLLDQCRSILILSDMAKS
jgi:hypothetical protein